MNWKGTHCSVCEKPLLEGEDIVVCPECGAPYHRACYAKNGTCVFADKHGKGFEYKRPGTSAETVRCHNCGTPNEKSHLFCENCGVPLAEDAVAEREAHVSNAGAARGNLPAGTGNVPGSPAGQTRTNTYASQPVFPGMPEDVAQMFAQNGMMPVSKEYDGIATADWIQYIGNSAPYYLYQFDRMDKTGRKTSVCWSALFLGPLYFFFRKMWGWAVATSLASLFVSIPTFLYLLQTLNMAAGFILSDAALSTLSFLCMVGSWALSVFLGLFAFYLFRRHAAKKMHTMKAASATQTEYHEKLVRHGGPSRIAVVAVVLLMFIASTLFVSWIGPDQLASLYLF